MMTDPIAVIVRFNGDPDDLFKTDDGIAIINAWETEPDHHAFGRRLGPYLQAVGIGRPYQHEHLRIEKLGLGLTPLRELGRAAHERGHALH